MSAAIVTVQMPEPRLRAILGDRLDELRSALRLLADAEVALERNVYVERHDEADSGTLRAVIEYHRGAVRRLRDEIGLLLSVLSPIDHAAVAESPSLDELVVRIAAWQAVTFPHATALSVAKHIAREAAELQADPGDASEIADLFHMLVSACVQNGVSLADIVAAKFATNQSRSWGVPDADGVVEHVEVAS